MSSFKQYNFQPFLIDAIEKLGFHAPTAIQEKMIPMINRGQSAIGQSQTGTGKTHSYLLPLINRIEADRQEVQVVITAPTRELARQIHHEVKFLIEDTALTTKVFVGGTDKQRAIEKLKQQPHIVVGTPGRINDLVSEQALQVYTANAIVIDEADLMLEMGFIEDVDQVAARMKEDLQIYVFSATIPEKLKPFLKKYMENPQYAHIEPKQIQAENIEFVLVPQKSRSREAVLLDTLNAINPYLAIVFTNTKSKADEVADYLLNKGLKTGRVHGGLSPRERNKMMKQIRDLEYQYIVATDLAARGIDIPGVSHVINFELPQDLDFFIHRVGRTARAGHSGTAITIYEPSDEDALAQIEKKGIQFSHQEVKAGEWVKLNDRHKRSSRPKGENEIDKKAKSLVRKPKKVKPGYKKKMNYKMEQIKKKERRKNRRNNN
ncbi:DEAD/DEAH box helicase [Jeotgalibacillus haloalkalitolerans]|uniref:DEAD-box ATP-dependent RNA helicase CshB n=1 Tax=Jeotgalibacillus haloalkalitolerans TaxID=3104292 RepID=A0ABU5KLT4_9BACL|nr:DEAD/DEAH box helicase [Jeotgalibacillus sp. HH7-29]MDZ5712188.1 DEAD/DEAH box helicase [Jeotgalibacillus sp. HH7-29]